MSCAYFQITYDGPGLDNHTMDVHDLAPALLSLGDVVEEANRLLNADGPTVSLRVRSSFKTGSFGIEFDVIQNLLDQALQLFKDSPVAGAKDLIEYLGFIVGATGAAGAGLIKLLQWMRGRSVKEVVLLDNGKVRFIVDEDAFETEKQVLELFRCYKLRLALEKVIADPLEKAAIDSVALTDDPGKGFVTISKDERHWFKAPPQDDELITDLEEEASLQVVSVSFRDDNKWRFSDGGAAFHAAIMDDDFRNRVKQSEESFSAGDILRVRLRKKQWLVREAIYSGPRF